MRLCLLVVSIGSQGRRCLGRMARRPQCGVDGSLVCNSRHWGGILILRSVKGSTKTRDGALRRGFGRGSVLRYYCEGSLSDDVGARSVGLAEVLAHLCFIDRLPTAF